MTFKMHDFKTQDREFFLECARKFYDSDAVIDRVSEKFFERTFEECIKGSPYTQGMVITADGNNAGFLLLSFTYSNEVGGMVVLIEELYLKPEYQSKGIGSQIFDIIENIYVNAGKAKRLRLEVSKDNTEAIKLYDRLGYKPLEYIQMYKNFV